LTERSFSQILRRTDEGFPEIPEIRSGKPPAIPHWRDRSESNVLAAQKGGWSGSDPA